eukprot:108125-Lingulodinium_polyedra.AAC.2
MDRIERDPGLLSWKEVQHLGLKHGAARARLEELKIGDLNVELLVRAPNLVPRPLESSRKISKGCKTEGYL